MKLPGIKLGVNFLKIVVGVVFSLIWGRVMYFFWPQPSYLLFVFFYLIAGSVLIKWLFFEIIDRVNLRLRLKKIRQEIDESGLRVQEVVESGYAENELREKSGSFDNIKSFHKKMNLLVQEVLLFGDRVKEALERAVRSLEEKDATLAASVIDDDINIDARRYILENYCIQLIRTHHAGTRDLRRLVAILSIVTELERMADYAEGIAKIALMIGEEPYFKPPVEFQQMAIRAREMLSGSLESFRDNDIERARSVARQDDRVDMLYDQVFRHLVTLMIENPGDITRITWLVWAAHNLERFADRVTNICERVVFSVSGEIADFKVSKY